DAPGAKGTPGTLSAAPVGTSPATTPLPTTTVPVPTTAPPVATTTTPPRTPTAEAPLRVYVGGDSQVAFLGPSLARRAEARAPGLVTVVETDYRNSTGLARPDVFDWPLHVAVDVAGDD